MKTMRLMTFHRSACTQAARCIAAGLLIGALAPTAMATPSGGQWETGTGTINNSGGNLTITPNFNNSIMSWVGFDIGIGQQVEFAVPDASWRVLNRINSPSASLIQGSLLSTGQIYLINPNGITFSSTAIVNAGRIYAAAGMMSDADFLGGIDRFTGLSGVVSNAGQITAGEVHFTGDQILNRASGTINGGLISFSTGDEVVIQRVGDGIALRIDGQDLDAPTAGPVQATLSGNAAISNAGTVQSNTNGPIHLAAGDMYGLALLNSGTIRSAGGSVELSARGGVIHNEASGVVTTASSSGSGGDISINAPALVNRGMVDTSTSSFVTGNAAGDIDIDTFSNALFTDGSNLRATANFAGDGGEIDVVASNGTVTFAEGSTAHAKGGLIGGDGGLVRISGEQVAYYATTKVGSSGGEDGRLQVNVDELFDVFTPTVTHNDPVFIADLRTPISVMSRVGDNVLNMFDGHVDLYSRDSVAVNSTFNLRNHDLTISADRNVLMAAEPTALRNLDITADLDGIDGGQITLLTDLNDIANDASFTAPNIFVFGGRGNGNGGGGGSVQVTTGGSQVWDGPVRLGSDLTVIANGTSYVGDITFTNDINGGHDLVLDAVGVGSLMNVGNTSELDLMDLRAHLLELNGSEMLATNDILLNAAGRGALHDAATIYGSAADLRIESANGNIRMGQHEAFTQHGGNLTLRALAGEIDLGDVNTLGDMTVDAPLIRLLRHNGGNVLLPDGSMGLLEGVHYLAGGTIDFSSTPILGGTGTIAPMFASDGVSADAEGVLSGFDWIDNDPTTIDDFVDAAGVVLNVIPNESTGGGGTDVDPPTDGPGDDGGTGTDVPTPPADPPAVPASVLELPTDALDAELNESTTIAAGEQLGVLSDEEDFNIDDPLEGPLTLVTLADLSIEMERVTENPQDQLGAVTRGDILANYPVNNINPDTGNIRVKERRLNSMIVEQTLLGYQNVLSSQPGDSLVNIESNNTSAIGNSLQTSWSAYTAADTNPTAGGFRTYLAQNESQGASNAYVEGLRTVFSDLGRSGVTGYELGYSRDATAQRIVDSATTAGGLNGATLSSLLR